MMLQRGFDVSDRYFRVAASTHVKDGRVRYVSAGYVCAERVALE
jgi:hypothetical protein